MRKIQVVTDYELYKYEELDSKGKEKAKRKYLDGQDEYGFTDMVEADTFSELFSGRRLECLRIFGL